MAYFSEIRYCSQCRAELGKDDYTSAHGWCKRCNDTVPITSCKVPYWVLAIALGLVLAAQLAAWC